MNTTLRAYLDELQQLLEQEALEEVMGHCRHILQHYPKNVETYRLLGRALLDKTRHDEAGNVFQRVLSALPDDFISHLGLSGIAEESGQLPAAIWHLERAYEQEPNNGALRDEIKRLVEKRDGQPAPRIQLTRGGLAHTYAKGRMYEQAITELQSALEQMPERIDLQLLLAKVLWESERPIEASDVALKVLDTLPNSIEANQIMARLWLKANRPSDAAPFISRLEQLDPFLAWATVHPDGEEFPREALQLPRLQWDARAAAAMTTDAPDWVRSLPDVFESPENISLTGNVNNWLESAAPAPTSGKSSLLKRNNPASQPLESEEVPDWFKESAGQDATADGGIDEVPDWFKEPSATAAVPDLALGAAVAAEEVPDWFADPAPQAASDMGIDSPTAASQIPDWLDEAPADQPQTAETPAAVEVPSWLDDDLPSMDDVVGEQLPSGFTNLLAGSSPRSGNQTMTPEAAGSAAIPDWLSDAQPDESQAAAPAGEALDAMAWLSDEPMSIPQADTSASAEPALSFDDMFGNTPQTEESLAAEPTESAPDWLIGMTAAQPAAASAAPSSAEDEMSLSFDDMFGGTPQTEESLAAEPAESAPDWLIGMTAAQPAAASAAPSSAEDEMSLSFDDMFGGTPQTEESLAAEPAESAPDWLIGMTAAQPAAASAAPSSAEDEMSLSFDDMFGGTPQTEESAAQPADSGLDWLSSLPDMASADGSAPPATSSTAAASIEDMFGSTPQAEQPAAQPANSGLGSAAGSFGTPSTEDWMGRAEPAVEDDPLAWIRPYAEGETDQAGINSMQTEQSGLSQADEPLAQGETPDWLTSMAPATTPAAPVDAAALDFSTLDLGGMSNELPQDQEPLVRGETPDWLTSMAPPATPAAPVDANALDFSTLDLGGMSDAQDQEPLAQGETPDWLTSMAPASTPAAPVDANALDFSTLDMGGASDELPQDQEPLVQGETPDWLTSMAPASTPAAPVDGGALDFSTLDMGGASDEGDDWLAASPSALPAGSAESTEPAEDWFGSSGSANQEPAAEIPGTADLDWLGQPVAPSQFQPQSAGESPSSTELEDDWLASFEAPTSEPAVPASSDDSWLSQLGSSTPDAASAEGGSFDMSSTAAPAASSADDWLGSLSTGEPVAEEPLEPPGTTSTAGIMGDDWLTSIAAPSTESAASIEDWSAESPEPEAMDTEPEPDADVPDWMRGMAPAASATNSTHDWMPPEAQDEFNRLLEGAAQNLSQPRETRDTGVLDSAELPDWLNAFAGSSEGTPSEEPAYTGDAGKSPSVSMALADLNFENLDTMDQPEPLAPGDAPDWLSNIAPKQPAQNSVPAPSLEDMDFAGLAVGTAAEEAAAGDAPDWLKAMAPADAGAKPAEPKAAPQGSGSSDFAFDFDRVAQPTNLVNTKPESGNESQPVDSGFSFKRTPAWMKKKSSSGDQK